MKNKKNKIPQDFLDEVLFRYKFNIWRKRLVNCKFENKRLNYIFNFFYFASFVSALSIVPFLIIPLILYIAIHNSDQMTNYAILQLLFTALGMPLVSIVFCLICIIIYKWIPNKKYVLNFNNWSIKKW